MYRSKNDSTAALHTDLGHALWRQIWNYNNLMYIQGIVGIYQ